MRALDFVNVRKSYPSPAGAALVALDDFTLTVEPGRFVTVVGPSGCGKTTLLRMAAGLMSPDKAARSASTASRSPAPAPRCRWCSRASA